MAHLLRTTTLLVTLLLGLSPAGAQSYTQTSVPYSYDDPTLLGSPPLVLTDESFVTVALPAPFPFYGVQYSSISISDNGGIRFGNNLIIDPQNNCIPSASPGGDPDIALYWDDLVPGPNTEVYFSGASSPNRFLVTFVDIEHGQASGGGTATFQLALFPSGALEIRHQQALFGDPLLDDGASATIGIQNVVGNTHGTGDFLQASCNVPVSTTNTATQFCDPADADADGFSMCTGDCDDSDPTRAPDLTEICDAIDQDCD
ncbi:MAG: putative metal-binding motif-containing protein, partial [Myxococcota bacterium]|nr:putative metal-binding motif-containing protein [Myxococcota bacterium]